VPERSTIEAGLATWTMRTTLSDIGTRHRQRANVLCNMVLLLEMGIVVGRAVLEDFGVGPGGQD
jgi:hypothetical protein